MRKPVSKNSLRRAMDRAIADGQLECTVPLNTVIDRIWHDMSRENYNGGWDRVLGQAFAGHLARAA